MTKPLPQKSGNLRSKYNRLFVILCVSSDEESLVEGEGGNETLRLDLSARLCLEVKDDKAVTLCPHNNLIQFLKLHQNKSINREQDDQVEAWEP